MRRPRNPRMQLEPLLGTTPVQPARTAPEKTALLVSSLLSLLHLPKFLGRSDSLCCVHTMQDGRNLLALSLPSSLALRAAMRSLATWAADGDSFLLPFSLLPLLLLVLLCRDGAEREFVMAEPPAWPPLPPTLGRAGFFLLLLLLLPHSPLPSLFLTMGRRPATPLLMLTLSLAKARTGIASSLWQNEARKSQKARTTS